MNVAPRGHRRRHHHRNTTKNPHPAPLEWDDALVDVQMETESVPVFGLAHLVLVALALTLAPTKV